MGYRSEVVLAISKQIMPHFLAVLAKEPETRPLIFKHHDHLDQNYNNEGTLLVTWEGIKWYDSYPEIQAINEFIQEAEADGIEGFELPENEWQGNHVRFVRLGEEYDDCDSRGELHYGDIHMERSLCY